jgi:hypothetical protein
MTPTAESPYRSVTLTDDIEILAADPENQTYFAVAPIQS